MAAMKVELQPEFGYCMLVFIFSIFQLTWMALKVRAARNKFNVHPPQLYSTKPGDVEFNCTMRAHLNTIEGYSQFCALLFLGGLKHPVLSAVGGAVFVAFRFPYFIGYATGEAKNRRWGAPQYLGQLLCIGCVISGALSLLGFI